MLAWLGTAAAAAEELRTWSDSSGKYKIKATLIEVQDGKVVLRREDGSKFQIELKKLSTVDQKYVDENASDTADAANPFQAMKESADDESAAKEADAKEGDEQPVAKEPKLIKARWNGVRMVAMTPSGDWKFSPIAPAEETPVRKKALALPPTIDFFEGLKAMVVNSTSHRAVLGYTFEQRGAGRPQALSRQTRLVLCDLEGGRVASGTAPGLMLPLALADSGDQVLMCREEFGFGNHDRLELWSLTRSGVTRDIQWYPYDDAQHGDRDVKWAAFLDDQRLATLSGSGRLAVWKLEPLRPVYCLQIDNSCLPALSSDRKHLAFVVNKQVGVLDVKAGDVLAAQPFPAPPSSVLSFSPKGTRLACLGFDKLYVWDFTTGEPYREMLLTGWHAGSDVLWTSEEHLLVGKHNLVDVENQVKLWHYDGPQAAAFCDGVCWLAVAPGHQQAGALVPLRLPHPGLKEHLDQAMQDPNFFVLRPGVAVRLNVDGLADPGERDKVRAALTEKLQARGFQVGLNGTVDLIASTEPGKETEVAYHSFGSIGSRIYKFQQHMVRLKFVAQGQTIWETSSSNVPGFLQLKEGETVEQRLRQHEKPNYDWFKAIEIPKIATKSSANGTLGQSIVTTAGLQDIPAPGAGPVPFVPRAASGRRR
jgi:hypothetical protein